MASSSMSEREAAVYDRAIRLWGADAQKRLMSAKVLVSGMTGLTAELCKNLALSGVSLVIHDPAVVSSADLSANFFLTVEDVGNARADACVERVRELNPLVAIDVHVGDLPGPGDAGFWSSFAVVCTGGLSRARNAELAAACRRHGAAFFGGAAHGLVSVFASDLGPAHRFKRAGGETQAAVGMAFKEDASAAVAVVATPTFTDVVSAGPSAVLPMISRRRRRDPTATTNDAAPSWVAVQGVESELAARGAEAPPAAADERTTFQGAVLERLSAAAEGEAAAAVSADAVRAVVSTFGLSVAPVCAVAGGQWGQEVIRAITGRRPPLGNVFVFDARGHPQGQFGWVPRAPEGV